METGENGALSTGHFYSSRMKFQTANEQFEYLFGLQIRGTPFELHVSGRDGKQPQNELIGY